MGQINNKIDDAIDDAFRELVYKRYGLKKGTDECNIKKDTIPLK